MNPNIRNSSKTETRTSGPALAAAALLATAVSFGQVASAATPPADAWTQAGGNAAHSSFNPGEAIINASTASNLTYVRSFVAPPSFGECGDGIGAASVADGVLYLEMYSSVNAYELATGQLLWTVPNDRLGDHDYGELIVAGGRVFVSRDDCISQSDPDELLDAYDAETGEHLWARPASEPFDMVAFGGHLLIEGGLYTGFAADLDPATGTVRWQRRYAGAANCPGLASQAAPIVVATRLIVGVCSASATPRPQTEARALSDGHLLWKRQGAFGLRMGDAPGPAGTAAFGTGPSGRFVSVDARTGRTNWAVDGPVYTLAADRARVYGICDAVFCARDKGTGSVVWTDSGYDGYGASPVVLRDALLQPDGRVLDPTTGDGLGYVNFGNQPVSHFVIAQGWLIAVAAYPANRIVDAYRIPGS